MSGTDTLTGDNKLFLKMVLYCKEVLVMQDVKIKVFWQSMRRQIQNTSSIYFSFSVPKLLFLIYVIRIYYYYIV